MSRLGKRWLAVGVTWGVVLVMTGWNMYLISKLQYRQQELETTRMDKDYLKANAAVIGQMFTQKSRLIHQTQSFGLGFMVVENDLKRLAWEFGLRQMRVEAKNDMPDNRLVPIHVSTDGPLPAVLRWLVAVEKAYPYLVIADMDIAYDNIKRSGRFQAIFNYRYSLSQAERTG